MAIRIPFALLTVPRPKDQTGTEEGSIQIEVPVSVAQLQREGIAKQAVATAFAVVEQYKDVIGEVEPSSGRGVLEVSIRRSAMSLLLAEKSAKFVDLGAIAALSPRVADDIAWLKAAERTDNTFAGENQFEWNRTGGYGGKSAIQAEFNLRRAAATEQAHEFTAGAVGFLAAPDNTILPLALLTRPEQRAQALTDILLQFRSRSDKTGQAENSQFHRIDRKGPVEVAELRIVLAGAELGFDTQAQQQEYALLTHVVGSHPTSSVNGIYQARNLVAQMAVDQAETSMAWMKTDIPGGTDTAPYGAIHHNYSRDTPHHIRCFINEWMFPVGESALRGETFVRLVDVLKQARGGDVVGARLQLQAAARMNPAVAALVVQLEGVGDAGFASVLKDKLVGISTKPLGADPEEFLAQAAQLFGIVVDSRPTVDSINQELFRAGDAWPNVANVVAQMRAANTQGTLVELGKARVAMRDTIIAAQTGYERHELIKFDAQLARITTEELGASVHRVGNVKTAAQQNECLIALQTALRAASASGIDAIKDRNDDAAHKGEGLAQVLQDIDAAVEGGRVDESAYRELMGRAYVATARTVQNVRCCVDSRAANIAQAGISLDPMFMDQLIKETPLHYATALAEKGMRVGLKEKITARSVENVEGMRVLNSIGPVVFSSVVMSENSKDLARLGTSKDQLAVLFQLEEKKMVAVGGLFVDSAHAPGGNSHLNMYAMNNGIPVIALPELRTKYAEFFASAQREGGVYVDDTGGNFRMLTVQKAIEDGSLPGARVGDAHSIQEAIEKLRPGVNRKVRYLEPTSDEKSFQLVATHEAVINAQRQTRHVELYVPKDEVRGVGRGVPTFEAIAGLGIHARHIAGEKGCVLALLAQHPLLGKHVPRGSQFTPGDIRAALQAAVDPHSGRSLQSMWDGVWSQDPKIGSVNDEGTKETNPNHFLNSAFYSDRAYRAKMRETLQAATREGLSKLWVRSLFEIKVKTGSGDASQLPGRRHGKEILESLAERYQTSSAAILKLNGLTPGAPLPPSLRVIPQELTTAGQQVYDQMKKNPALSNSDNWIARSSFTGEDRPGKSGAGQYESFPNLRNPVSRMLGLVGVVESTWMPEPIENNAAEQFFLKHIGPTVIIQHCLAPDISGVIISRNVETGARNEITFQLVKGFGGGVEGGLTTEGSVSGNSLSVNITNGREGRGNTVDVGGIAVSQADMLALRALVLETEKFFNETLEPGKGHAVDMEVARVDGEWKIVQARVILMDK